MSENTAVIKFVDAYGIDREVVIVGDFTIGRKDQGAESKLCIMGAGGDSVEIMKCDRSVSRKHLRCYWNNGKLYVQDVGSVNGSEINDITLEGWAKKNPSKPLQIPGKVKVTLSKNFNINLQPQKQKTEVEQALSQAGIAPGTPVIINIDKSKHIGNMDIVANRSNLVLDAEDPDDTSATENKKKQNQQ